MKSYLMSVEIKDLKLKVFHLTTKYKFRVQQNEMNS